MENWITSFVFAVNAKLKSPIQVLPYIRLWAFDMSSHIVDIVYEHSTRYSCTKYTFQYTFHYLKLVFQHNTFRFIKIKYILFYYIYAIESSQIVRAVGVCPVSIVEQNHNFQFFIYLRVLYLTYLFIFSLQYHD